MAETLTYQASEPAPENTVVLTEAEQETLEVAEQLEQEQGTAKLAGKFDSPEQLEKAYMELQSKLGSQESPTSEAEQKEEQPESQPDEQEGEFDSSFLDQLYEQAQGEPSEELVNKLKEMDVTDLADMYVQYRQQVEANQQQQQPTTPDLSEEQVDALYNIVGGREEYGQLTSWASENLTEQEAAMFDAVMDTGDPNAAYWAIRGLALQYADSNGYEGKRISGKAPSPVDNSFRSQAELVQAMSDPRYESDTAYRNDVMAKLENSNLDF